MNTLLLYVGCFIFAFLFIKLLYNNRIVLVSGNKHYVTNSWLYNFIVLFFSLLPVLYIIGERNNVGTDYTNYLTMYHDYTQWGYKNFEPAITFLFDVANWAGIDFKGFLWIAAVVSVFLSSYALCRYLDREYASIACLLYLCLYFGPACNIIAQTMALSFLIFSFDKIINKKPFAFLFLCFIAASIHTASLIIIPFYWIYNLTGKNRNWFVAIIALLLAIVFAIKPSAIVSILNSIGLSQYAVYARHASIKTFLVLFMYRFPLYILEIVSYKKIIEKDINYKLYYLFLVFELVGIILGIGISWIGRIVYFFSIAHVFIDLEIIKAEKHETIKLQYKWVLIAYYLVAFSMMHFVSDFDGINTYHM